MVSLLRRVLSTVGGEKGKEIASYLDFGDEFNDHESELLLKRQINIENLILVSERVGGVEGYGGATRGSGVLRKINDALGAGITVDRIELSSLFIKLTSVSDLIHDLLKTMPFTIHVGKLRIALEIDAAKQNPLPTAAVLKATRAAALDAAAAKLDAATAAVAAAGEGLGEAAAAAAAAAFDESGGGGPFSNAKLADLLKGVLRGLNISVDALEVELRMVEPATRTKGYTVQISAAKLEFLGGEINTGGTRFCQKLALGNFTCALDPRDGRVAVMIVPGLPPPGIIVDFTLNYNPEVANCPHWPAIAHLAIHAALALRLSASDLSRVLLVLKESSNAGARRTFTNAAALRDVQLAAEKGGADCELLLAATAWSETSGCGLTAEERAASEAKLAAMNDATRVAKAFGAGPVLPAYSKFAMEVRADVHLDEISVVIVGTPSTNSLVVALRGLVVNASAEHVHGKGWGGAALGLSLESVRVHVHQTKADGSSRDLVLIDRASEVVDSDRLLVEQSGIVVISYGAVTRGNRLADTGDVSVTFGDVDVRLSVAAAAAIASIVAQITCASSKCTLDASVTEFLNARAAAATEAAAEVALKRPISFQPPGKIRAALLQVLNLAKMLNLRVLVHTIRLYIDTMESSEESQRSLIQLDLGVVDIALRRTSLRDDGDDVFDDGDDFSHSLLENAHFITGMFPLVLRCIGADSTAEVERICNENPVDCSLRIQRVAIVAQSSGRRELLKATFDELAVLASLSLDPSDCAAEETIPAWRCIGVVPVRVSAESDAAVSRELEVGELLVEVSRVAGVNGERLLQFRDDTTDSNELRWTTINQADDAVFLCPTTPAKKPFEQLAPVITTACVLIREGVVDVTPTILATTLSSGIKEIQRAVKDATDVVNAEGTDETRSGVSTGVATSPALLKCGKTHPILAKALSLARGRLLGGTLSDEDFANIEEILSAAAAGEVTTGEASPATTPAAARRAITGGAAQRRRASVELQRSGGGGATKSLAGALWQGDGDTRACPLCARSFTLIARRHHCRVCGRVVCGVCSSSRVRVVTADQQDASAATRPPIVRVCDTCVTEGRRVNVIVGDGNLLVAELVRIWRAPDENEEANDGFFRRSLGWPRHYMEGAAFAAVASSVSTPPSPATTVGPTSVDLPPSRIEQSRRAAVRAASKESRVEERRKENATSMPQIKFLLALHIDSMQRLAHARELMWPAGDLHVSTSAFSFVTHNFQVTNHGVADKALKVLKVKCSNSLHDALARYYAAAAPTAASELMELASMYERRESELVARLALCETSGNGLLPLASFVSGVDISAGAYCERCTVELEPYRDPLGSHVACDSCYKKLSPKTIVWHCPVKGCSYNLCSSCESLSDHTIPSCGLVLSIKEDRRVSSRATAEKAVEDSGELQKGPETPELLFALVFQGGLRIYRGRTCIETIKLSLVTEMRLLNDDISRTEKTLSLLSAEFAAGASSAFGTGSSSASASVAAPPLPKEPQSSATSDPPAPVEQAVAQKKFSFSTADKFFKRGIKDFEDKLSKVAVDVTSAVTSAATDVSNTLDKVAEDMTHTFDKVAEDVTVTVVGSATKPIQQRSFGFQLLTPASPFGGVKFLVQTEEERDRWVARLAYALPYTALGSVQRNPVYLHRAVRLLQKRFRARVAGRSTVQRSRARAATSSTFSQMELALLERTVDLALCVAQSAVTFADLTIDEYERSVREDVVIPVGPPSQSIQLPLAGCLLLRGLASAGGFNQAQIAKQLAHGAVCSQSAGDVSTRIPTCMVQSCVATSAQGVDARTELRVLNFGGAECIASALFASETARGGDETAWGRLVQTMNDVLRQKSAAAAQARSDALMWTHALGDAYTKHVFAAIECLEAEDMASATMGAMIRGPTKREVSHRIVGPRSHLKNGSRVALLSASGDFLSTLHRTVDATAQTLTATEVFEIAWVGDDITLKASNGKFLVARAPSLLNLNLGDIVLMDAAASTPEARAFHLAVVTHGVPQTPIRGLLSSTYVRGAVTLRSSLDGSGRCISMQPGGSVICNVDNHSVDEIIRLVAVTNLHRPDNLLFIDPSL